MLNPTQITELVELAERYVADAIKAKKAGRDAEHDHFNGCAVGISSSLFKLGHWEECNKLRKSIYAQVAIPFTPESFPELPHVKEWNEDLPRTDRHDWRLAHCAYGLSVMICLTADPHVTAEVWAVDEPSSLTAHFGFSLPRDEASRLPPLRLKQLLNLVQTELPEETVNSVASGLTRQIQVWRISRDVLASL